MMRQNLEPGRTCGDRVCPCAGAQEHAGRRFLSAPAPAPTVYQGDAARDPKAADLLFILSADQVRGMSQ